MKFVKLAVVFAVGYVLGSRAGRGRYEQMRDLTHRVSEDPRVQQAASRAEDLVREAMDTTRTQGRQDREDSSWPEHPDAHVEVPDDEVVHTSGPQDR